MENEVVTKDLSVGEQFPVETANGVKQITVRIIEQKNEYTVIRSVG